MKVTTYSTTGKKQEEIELPTIFDTPIRPDLIHKVYVNLNTHRFQPQGRRPTAGMDVVARSLDPPTGHGQARVARMRGGGGGRQGEGGGVASVRGGRQAHPPASEKAIYKRVNKKENKLALCSAIAATSSKEFVQKRGHAVDNVDVFPIILSDDIEGLSKTKEVTEVLEHLNLIQDVNRLKNRKRKTGKASLRGRTKKIGKSVLFVVKSAKNLRKACGSIPGVDVAEANSLSVLDLAPGAMPSRLTVYSKGAMEDISKIKSPHLELMVKIR